MNIEKEGFAHKKERYTFQVKPLQTVVLDRVPCVTCKAAYEFMDWYLHNTYGHHPDVVHFKNSIGKKYTKKIPKRVFSRTMRIELAYRQRYCCNHCRVLLPPDFEVDHIVPLEDSGQDHPDNLQCLCVPCHARKTRLERLLKTSLFHANAQKEYDKWHAVSMEARKNFIEMDGTPKVTPLTGEEFPEQVAGSNASNETDDFLGMYDDDSADDTGTESGVFSKYFLRNNETDQKN